jgi:hypothetical protein
MLDGKEVRRLIDGSLKILVEEIRKEWKAQGKIASGKAFESIETELKLRVDSIEANVLVEDYMMYQDTGIEPGNIAFSPGSGRGGKSALIQGLVEWSKEKGIAMSSEEDRLGFAFAVATVMSREGMPTNNSKSFSPSGRNLHWSDYAEKEALPRLEDQLGEGRIVQTLLDNMVNEINASSNG